MKKQGWILIAITCAFFCLLAGVFLGRNSNKAYIQIQDIDSVQTQPTEKRRRLRQPKAAGCIEGPAGPSIINPQGP